MYRPEDDDDYEIEKVKPLEGEIKALTKQQTITRNRKKELFHKKSTMIAPVIDSELLSGSSAN